jgi:hypothetical protein
VEPDTTKPKSVDNLPNISRLTSSVSSRQQLWISPSQGALTMVFDEECMCCAREYVRLAGLTDNLKVRDQLIDFARGWMATAQGKGRRDQARVVTLARGAVRNSDVRHNRSHALPALALACEQLIVPAFARVAG